MKQHITPKQAAEVSEIEFYSLFPEGIVKREDWANYHHKKVTIGKMIECLGVNYSIVVNIPNDKYGFIPLCTISSGSDFYLSQYFRLDRLCDQLWEACKNRFTLIRNHS